MSHSFDASGPLAKDARELTDLLTILVDCGKTEVPAGGYALVIDDTWYVDDSI
jgi:hypothetical protein